MSEFWNQKPEVVSCLIEPAILPTSGIMVVTGEPGVGKSFLTQEMAFELACGKRLLGLFPTKAVKVACLELEKRTPIARKRFRHPGLLLEYPESKYNLGYCDEEVPQVDTEFGANMLKEALKNFEARVAIIDSYTLTLADEIELSNQKRAIRNYRAIAKELNLSFIIIQHLVKRGTVFDYKRGEFRAPPLQLDDLRGSKTLEYEVDTVVGLVHSKIRGIRELAFLKSSYSPFPLSEEAPISLCFDGSEPKPFSPSSDVVSIINKVDRNPVVFVEELEKELGKTRPTILRILERLKGFGLIDIIEGKGRGSRTFIKQILYWGGAANH